MELGRRVGRLVGLLWEWNKKEERVEDGGYEERGNMGVVRFWIRFKSID